MDKGLQMERLAVSYAPGEDERQREIIRAAGAFLFFALGVISVMETFLSYFQTELNRGMYYWIGTGVLITVVFAGVRIRRTWWLLPGLCAFFCLTAVTSWRKIVNGLVLLVNAMLAVLQDYYDLGAGPLPLISGTQARIEWGLFLLVIIVAMVLGACVLGKPRSIPAVLLVLPMTLYGMFFDVMPNLFWCILAIGFIAALCVMQKTSDISMWCLSALGVMAAILAVSGVFRAISPPLAYTHLEIFDRIYDASSEWLDTMGIFVEGTEGRSRLGIGGGRLGSVGFAQAESQEVFKIRTYRPDPNLYLRSYVGAEYRSNSWNPLSSKYADGAPARRVKELSQRSGLNAYNQSYYIDSCIAQQWWIMREYFSSRANFYKTHLRRKILFDESAGKYYYVPYGSNFGGELFAFDAYPLNAEKDMEYDCVILANQDYGAYKRLADEYAGKTIGEELDTYIEWEKAYREFVYKAYVQVPDGIFDGLELSVDYRRQRTAMEVDGYIGEIQEMFASYTYNTSPEPITWSEDFVRNFLKNREGYCASFASAGVLLLRSAGIPARYVEGYCVSGSEISGVGYDANIDWNKNPQFYRQYYTTVYDSDAHSWAEVYRDGYGWVPVEFTLRYANDGQGGQEPGQDATVAESQSGEKESVPLDAEEEEEETDSPWVPGDDLPQSDLSENGKDYPLIRVMLPALAAGTMLLVSFLAYWKKRVAREALLCGKAERPGRAAELWRYMEKLMAEMGCVRNFNENYENLAKEAASKFNSFTEEEMHDIIEMILMVRFSGQSEEAAHWRRLREAAVKMRGDLYEAKGEREKFVLKYIKGY